MSTINANAKTTKKVNTINDVAKASVKAITLEKANAMLAKALEKSEGLTKDRAKALYAIKANKLYEGQAEDFKTYINDVCDGVLYGVKYNQANNLSNMYNYVWAVKDFSDYDSNKANVLVAYVKKDFAKVMAMHKKGRISPVMNKAEITEALKAEFGGQCKTVAKGEKVKAGANDELMVAIAQVNHFIKKNAEKNGIIAKSWQTIMEALNV